MFYLEITFLETDLILRVAIGVEFKESGYEANYTQDVHHGSEVK